MKTICLFGISNSGKTRTLGSFAKDLDKSSQSKLINGGIPLLYEDFHAVFKYRGKKVGIGSEGDTSNQVELNLDRLKKLKCDIIIIAARSYGQSHDIISDFSGEDEVIWLRQRDVWRDEDIDRETLMTESNAQTANLIFSLVEKLST